jgi:hypothetical protein
VRPPRIGAALILVLALCGSLHAAQEVVHPKPVRLRHLSGTVVDPRGFPIAYAIIELHGASGEQILATTFADAFGKFSFADRKRGDQFQLRASQKGFDTVRYSVVESLVGKERLRMVLPVAT